MKWILFNRVTFLTDAVDLNVYKPMFSVFLCVCSISLVWYLFCSVFFALCEIHRMNQMCRFHVNCSRSTARKKSSFSASIGKKEIIERVYSLTTTLFVEIKSVFCKLKVVTCRFNSEYHHKIRFKCMKAVQNKSQYKIVCWFKMRHNISLVENR